MKQSKSAAAAFATTRRPAGGDGDPLLAALRGADLDAAWQQCIDAWEQDAPGYGAVARADSETLRNDLVARLSVVTDPEERRACALLACLRLRADWFLLNTALGYAEDEADCGAGILHAALASSLLDVLEAHLPAEDVRLISDFAADLMAGGTPEGAPGSAFAADQPDVRQRLQSLLSTIESLSERVVRQEAELVILRAGQESLQEAFGGEVVSAGEVARRVTVLQARAEVHEAQAHVDAVHEQMLVQTFGTADRVRIAATAREMREAFAERGRRIERLEAERERAAAEAGEGIAPGDVAGHIRDLKGALNILAAEKLELEAAREALARETAELRAERDGLLSATGCATLGEVKGRMEELRQSAAALQDVAALLGDMGRTLDTV